MVHVDQLPVCRCNHTAYATWPWVGAGDVLHKITTAATWHLRVVRVLELAAAAGSWVLSLALLRRRWWAEATFAGLCAASMSCSTILDSSPRYLSAVFPVYALLGVWLARGSTRRRALYLAASLALSRSLHSDGACSGGSPEVPK